MDNLNEGVLNKLVDWAKKINPQNQEQKQDAKALAALMSDPKMQRQMQVVAVDKLVANFADSLKKTKDPKAKEATVQLFFNNWKTKTDPALLQAALKKYKLL